jgi:hypothetical protein
VLRSWPRARKCDCCVVKLGEAGSS